MYAICYQSVLVFLAIAVSTIVGTVAHCPAQDMRQLNPSMYPKLEINVERVKANGIRKLSGKYIDFYTDIRGQAEVDELPKIFDKSVEQLAEYFDVEKSKLTVYRVTGFLIQDRARFKSAGLMPNDLPDFLAGFNRGHEMWVYFQPGKYYTRHLLLHEGTHAFMQWMLQGSGPAWFSEGMAEKLSLHTWANGELKLNARPTSKEEFELWGRPKFIRVARNENRLLKLEEALQVAGSDFRKVEGYSWAWAACEFLSQHPRSAEAFKNLNLTCNNTTPTFTSDFLDSVAQNRRQLNRDWSRYLDEHDYGIEVKNILETEAVATPDRKMFKIEATAGWQSTKIQVTAGDRFLIRGKGGFQIAKKKAPWRSEANGVTIEYYRGRPLGLLLVGVSTDDDSDPIIRSQPVGLKSEIKIEKDGILCLRINDSPAALDDNKGFLTVSVEKLKD